MRATQAVRGAIANLWWDWYVRGSRHTGARIALFRHADPARVAVLADALEEAGYTRLAHAALGTAQRLVPTREGNWVVNLAVHTTTHADELIHGMGELLAVRQVAVTVRRVGGRHAACGLRHDLVRVDEPTARRLWKENVPFWIVGSRTPLYDWWIDYAQFTDPAVVKANGGTFDGRIDVWRVQHHGRYWSRYGGDPQFYIHRHTYETIKGD